MKETQKKALENFVDGQDELQELFNNPRGKPIDRNRMMLVVLHTTIDETFIWHCAIGLHKRKKEGRMLLSKWMPFEKVSARGQAILELDGVGKAETFKEWESDYY